MFHKPKMEIVEGNVVSVTYEREKEIKKLPMMLVGVKEIKIISKHPDPDLLLDL